jgi:hypothetical protein
LAAQFHPRFSQDRIALAVDRNVLPELAVDEIKDEFVAEFALRQYPSRRRRTDHPVDAIAPGGALLAAHPPDEELHRLHVQVFAFLVPDDGKFLLTPRTVALVCRHWDQFDAPLEVIREVYAARMLAVALGNAGLQRVGTLGGEAGLFVDFLGRDTRLALEQLELPIAQLFALGPVLLKVKQADHLAQDPVLGGQTLDRGALGGNRLLNGIPQIRGELIEVERHASCWRRE